VGLVLDDGCHELVVVGTQGHDVDVVVLAQELGHALTDEQRVLGDDQPQRHAASIREATHPPRGVGAVRIRPGGRGVRRYPPRVARSRTLISTAQGTHTHAFGPVEWGLLTFIAGVWGSSFLLIAIGIDAFAPGVVTFGRILFGFIGLSFAPAAR